jgi:hypothetical protein
MPAKNQTSLLSHSVQSAGLHIEWREPQRLKRIRKQPYGTGICAYPIEKIGP